MDAMLERSIHAAAIVLMLALGVAVLKWWQRRKAGRASPSLLPRSGIPSVVYFHSPSCGVCRASQKPILDRLALQLGAGKLQMVAVDASEKSEVARAWGVTTIPSTYVVGPSGKVMHVNNGLANEATLRRQLSAWL